MEINIVHHSDCLIFIFFSFGYLEKFEIWEIKEGVDGKNKATSFIAAAEEEEQAGGRGCWAAAAWVEKKSQPCCWLLLAAGCWRR